MIITEKFSRTVLCFAVLAGALVLVFTITGCGPRTKSVITATPIMHMYDFSDGEGKGCSFSMTPGAHKFGGSGPCKNDYAEAFWIDNPRDGIVFQIFNDPDCARHAGSWTWFEISNPLYGQRTAGVSVTAGSGEQKPHMVTRGIRILEAHGDRLEGKVSCVWVSDNG